MFAHPFWVLTAVQLAKILCSQKCTQKKLGHFLAGNRTGCSQDPCQVVWTRPGCRRADRPTRDPGSWHLPLHFPFLRSYDAVIGSKYPHKLGAPPARELAAQELGKLLPPSRSFSAPLTHHENEKGKGRPKGGVISLVSAVWPDEQDVIMRGILLSPLPSSVPSRRSAALLLLFPLPTACSAQSPPISIQSVAADGQDLPSTTPTTSPFSLGWRAMTAIPRSALVIAYGASRHASLRRRVSDMRSIDFVLTSPRAHRLRW